MFHNINYQYNIICMTHVSWPPEPVKLLHVTVRPMDTTTDTANDRRPATMISTTSIIPIKFILYNVCNEWSYQYHAFKLLSTHFLTKIILIIKHIIISAANIASVMDPNITKSHVWPPLYSTMFTVFPLSFLP